MACTLPWHECKKYEMCGHKLALTFLWEEHEVLQPTRHLLVVRIPHLQGDLYPVRHLPLPEVELNLHVGGVFRYCCHGGVGVASAAIIEAPHYEPLCAAKDDKSGKDLVVVQVQVPNIRLLGGDQGCRMLRTGRLPKPH